jgi:hypothetical protein
MKVYIAGPMAGYMDKQDYREKIKEILNKLSIPYVCPMEMDYDSLGEDETNRLAEIGETGTFTEKDKEAILEKIVKRDIKAINECNLMIAYAPVPSWGTGMEMFYHSYVRNMPLIVMNGIPASWLIAICDKFITTYEELEAVLKEYQLIEKGK